MHYWIDDGWNWVQEESSIATMLICTNTVVSDHDKLIPPIGVLEKFLNSGDELSQHGYVKFSGFKPSEDELTSVIQELEQLGYTKAVGADWVQSVDEWLIYLWNREHNVPLTEQLEFLRKRQVLEKELSKTSGLEVQNQIMLRIDMLFAEESAFKTRFIKH